mmetsp:Transcript_14559/g.36462  ORF Transcript_14559/g.36462 Transcript_14559/m.36462 type:complete len:364 (+) Transcript_14559:1786-2877(+)
MSDPSPPAPSGPPGSSSSSTPMPPLPRKPPPPPKKPPPRLSKFIDPWLCGSVLSAARRSISLGRHIAAQTSSAHRGATAAADDAGSSSSAPSTAHATSCSVIVLSPSSAARRYGGALRATDTTTSAAPRDAASPCDPHVALTSAGSTSLSAIQDVTSDAPPPLPPAPPIIPMPPMPPRHMPMPPPMPPPSGSAPYSFFRSSATLGVSTCSHMRARASCLLSHRYAPSSCGRRASKHATTREKYPAVRASSGLGALRNANSLSRSLGFSSIVPYTASTSQQNTSHATYGYLRFCCSVGGWKRYVSSWSTTSSRRRYVTSLLLRLLHSCMRSSSSRSSSSVNSSLSRIASTGDCCASPATRQNVP